MENVLKASAVRILEARALIDARYLDSRLLSVPAFGRAIGAQVLLKDETRNPIRSFKARGAYTFVRRELSPKEPLVTASAGNFGQALATAAIEREHSVTIFAAVTANAAKVAAMRAMGATVISAGDDFDAAKEHGRAWAAARGWRFVEDGNEPAIADGAGTIAVELMEQAATLDTVYIPVGNGALAEGMASYLKHAAPRLSVIGVVAAEAPCMLHSIRAGAPLPTATAGTIADGIGVRVPVPRAVEALRFLLDDVVSVTEDEILGAMRVLHATTRLEVEPSAAVGLAAIARRAKEVPGFRAATVLTGANLTEEQRRAWYDTPRSPGATA
jgi:threonine dehydratase